MAGKSGPTAVHIITILFGMASLILAVTTYIAFREHTRVAGELLSEQESKASNESQARRAQADTEALTRAFGGSGMNVGDAVSGDSSVLGIYTDTLNAYGGTEQQGTFRETLAAMRQRIITLQDTVAQSQTQMVRQTQDLLDAENEGQANIDNLRTQQGTDEDDIVRRINDNAEEIADLESDINRWTGDLQRAQQEKEELRDQLDQARSEGDRMVALLNDRVADLLDELNQLNEVAFDVPHGHIVRVENVTQLVYIDIGSRDLLREGVTLFVYVQNPQDNGRGPQDVKGKIEVVRILGPTQAEARVLDEDHDRPIAAGDPIYSPIWRANVVDEYAFVGIMDLDGDGVSDWDSIRDLVELSGARVDFYVDDEGVLQPPNGAISNYTTYLVVGEIPNPEDFFGDPERQERAAEIVRQHELRSREAAWYGVRVLRRNDFLTLMNWKPDLSGERGEMAQAEEPVGVESVRELLDTESPAVEP